MVDEGAPLVWVWEEALDSMGEPDSEGEVGLGVEEEEAGVEDPGADEPGADEPEAEEAGAEEAGAEETGEEDTGLEEGAALED